MRAKLIITIDLEDTSEGCVNLLYDERALRNTLIDGLEEDKDITVHSIEIEEAKENE